MEESDKFYDSFAEYNPKNQSWWKKYVNL